MLAMSDLLVLGLGSRVVLQIDGTLRRVDFILSSGNKKMLPYLP